MGSTHSLHKFLPAIAERSAPLRPLHSKKNEYNWTTECENAFQSNRLGVANIVELKHFDIHKDIRDMQAIMALEQFWSSWVQNGGVQSHLHRGS